MAAGPGLRILPVGQQCRRTMIGNLGKKDRDGRQVRIEHRGRNLRASRTGGVALRQEVRAGRIGLTANTSKGLRLSSALGPGTQVAMQNGRFVLRGVYGSGPLKFNLSKSGASASLASGVGRLNLTHPKRSSAKLFGVQVRGEKAAWMNLAAMLATGVAALVQLLVVALVGLVRALIWLGGAATVLARRAAARWRLHRQERAFRGLMETVDARLDQLSRTEWSAAMPETEGDAIALLEYLLDLNRPEDDDRPAPAVPGFLGERDVAGLEALDQLALARRAADVAMGGKPEAVVVERLLALDDRCVEGGGRSVAQEEMLGVIAEAGGVRVVAGQGGEA